MRYIHQPSPLETVTIIGDSSLTSLSSSSSNPVVIGLTNDILTSTNNNEPFYVEIHSRGLVYSTIILFIALITFLITFFINRFRLTKFYGIFFIIVWLFVVILMLLFVLNIFVVFYLVLFIFYFI